MSERLLELVNRVRLAGAGGAEHVLCGLAVVLHSLHGGETVMDFARFFGHDGHLRWPVSAFGLKKASADLLSTSCSRWERPSPRTGGDLARRGQPIASIVATAHELGSEAIQIRQPGSPRARGGRNVPCMSFDRVSPGRLAARRRATPALRGASPHPVLTLHRAIGNGAVARLLQRAPASRDTERPTSFGDRITGKNPAEKLRKFADLRKGAAVDAAAIVDDLEWDHLWGRSKSNVTGTGNQYSIRIDRQNPTPTHSNVQIQTNGTKISVATVLVADSPSGLRPTPKAPS